jgi:hypothetical protein
MVYLCGGSDEGQVHVTPILGLGGLCRVASNTIGAEIVRAYQWWIGDIIYRDNTRDI